MFYYCVFYVLCMSAAFVRNKLYMYNFDSEDRTGNTSRGKNTFKVFWLQWLSVSLFLLPFIMSRLVFSFVLVQQTRLIAPVALHIAKCMVMRSPDFTRRPASCVSPVVAIVRVALICCRQDTALPAASSTGRGRGRPGAGGCLYDLLNCLCLGCGTLRCLSRRTQQQQCTSSNDLQHVFDLSLSKQCTLKLVDFVSENVKKLLQRKSLSTSATSSSMCSCGSSSHMVCKATFNSSIVLGFS